MRLIIHELDAVLQLPGRSTTSARRRRASRA